MAHQQHPSAFQTYHSELGHALLSPAEERALGLRTRVGDPDAQDALVRSHLAYAVFIAKRFLGRGLELEDLVAVANLGLIQAARRFDPDRGGFRTYARPFMVGLIRREIAQSRARVSMPRQIATASLVLDRRVEELERTLGRAPTHEELAAGLNISGSLLRHALDCRGEVIPIGPRDPESEDAGVEPASDAPDALARMLEGERQHVLEEAVDSLPRREATILRHYFGVGRFQDTSLEEIATILGITRERVRQLMHQGLRTLRTGPYAPQLRELWGIHAEGS